MGQLGRLYWGGTQGGLFTQLARAQRVADAGRGLGLMIPKRRRGLPPLLLLLAVELGWWYCPASAADEGGGGCTDSAATNFNPQSVTDDGSCSYTQAHMRQQEGKVRATCHIFDDGAWPAALTGGAKATR
eukprot:COSAG01_NODE_31530_length_596_cov_0.591549_1_plen_129_part_10